MEIPVERLHEMFRYDAQTGVLTWRINPSTLPLAGTAAGTQKQYGRAVRYGRKTYYVHRIIWAMVTGKWPSCIIDHKDGDTANNRLDNLREATVSQNNRNKRISKANSSGFKGIVPAGNRWRAAIRAGGQYFNIGTFGTKEAAAAAYDAAATRLHGEFAKTNGISFA